MKDAGLSPSIPEDFEMLLKKAASLRTHLEKNKKDIHNKQSLHLIEAKIHKLSRYYKNKGAIPQDWKYDTAKVAM